MKEDNTNKKNSTLTTFLMGGAVGAALGLLLAPKPGRELRNDLNRILRGGLIGAGIGAGITLLLAPKPGREAREDVKRFALSAREKVATVIDKGKDIYAAGKEAAAGIPYVDGKPDDMHVM